MQVELALGLPETDHCKAGHQRFLGHRECGTPGDIQFRYAVRGQSYAASVHEGSSPSLGLPSWLLGPNPSKVSVSGFAAIRALGTFCT